MKEIIKSVLVHDSQYIEHRKKLLKMWCTILSEKTIGVWVREIEYKYIVEYLTHK